MEFYDKNGVELKVGDEVTSHVYGRGKVVAIRRRADCSGLWTQFDSGRSGEYSWGMSQQYLTFVDPDEPRDSAGPTNNAVCNVCGEPTFTGTSNLAAVGLVCATCWASKTRLERVALGWEADPYAEHRRYLRRTLGAETGLLEITGVPDLGRRAFPRYVENDHAPKPRPVDDPTGDDVAADAPGAAEYLGRGR